MQLELVSTARDRMIALSARMSEGLIGLETLVERLVISLLSGGHVLIEGAPGLAKTRAVKLLAQALMPALPVFNAPRT